MPSGNETTTKFKVDISELKKNIQEANRQIRLANAEFKTASAGMDSWSKSADGLSAKIAQTDKVLKAQKTILADYEKQLELISAEYGENSKEADEMRIKVENQRATVIKTEKSIGDFQSKLADLEAEQKKAADAAKLQETGLAKLEKTISDQESALKDLKTQYANVAIEQGKDSDAAKELASEIDRLSTELSDNRVKLKEVNDAADELDKSLADVSDGADGAGEGFTVLKGAIANLVANGINLAINGLKNLAKASYEAWQEYDNGADSIIAATGATGDAAEDLMKVYKNVSKNVVASYDDIGTAVGEVNTRFGATGDKLQDLSERFIKFADLNGVDLKSAIDSTQSAMAAWGIEAKDTGLMLDTLNKAGQDTGVSVDKLADLLVSNAPALKEMGYSASDSAMFLANLEKSGVEVSSTMAGMKKALQNAAKEGKPLSSAMTDIEDSIKNAESSTEAITIATELFGAKAGAAIAKAVRDGQLSFADLGTAMSDFEGNVESTFEDTLDAPDKFKLAVQNVRTELAETAGRIMDEYAPQIEKAFGVLINDVIPKIGNAVKWILDHSPEITAALAGIGAAIVAWNIASVVTNIIKMVNALKAMGAASAFAAAKQWLLNTALFANPIGLVVAAIAGLVTAFVVLWNKSEKFRNFWIGLWEKIKGAAEPVITALSEWFSEAWEKIKKVFAPAAKILGGYFKTAWKNIKVVWDVAVKFFKTI